MPGCPAILGFPVDSTSTFRSGSAEAPDSVRAASDSIESYSPLFDRDLVHSPFSDLGNLVFSGESLDQYLERIHDKIFQIVEQGAKPLSIGGEHTITLPAVRAVQSFYADLVVLHIDAHSDLRDQYERSFINHATVMRRVADIVGAERLIQLGVRAGTKEEFTWMRENGTILQWSPGAEKALLARIRMRPVYLSLDLDVLDPSSLPGTGNPEAGGWSYFDLERLFWVMDRAKLVGADVVELNPRLDPSGASSVSAAKIIRELLLILGRHRESR
jgi:agmatinase